MVFLSVCGGGGASSPGSVQENSFKLVPVFSLVREEEQIPPGVFLLFLSVNTVATVECN